MDEKLPGGEVDATLQPAQSQDLSNEDPNGPSETVSARKQSLSDIFTIVSVPCLTLHQHHANSPPQFAAGAALVSDGYFNNIMTMVNVLLKKEYPKEYTSIVSTRVSNSLLVGEIFGQVTVGLTCDYLGRKFAIILTTLMIVLGGILATASHGITTDGYLLSQISHKSPRC
jgi:hypothetical protein